MINSECVIKAQWVVSRKGLRSRARRRETAEESKNQARIGIKWFSTEISVHAYDHHICGWS